MARARGSAGRALSRAPQVLGKLDTLVKAWVRSVSASKGFTEPLLSEVRRRASVASST